MLCCEQVLSACVCLKVDFNHRLSELAKTSTFFFKFEIIYFSFVNAFEFDSQNTERERLREREI